MLEELESLESPFEILELGDGESISLRILDWKLGKGTIIPKGLGRSKLIRILRIWVPEELKAFEPRYYDITGQTLIYQLLPHLEKPDFKTKRFIVTKHGVAPRARFTLEVVPL